MFPAFPGGHSMECFYVGVRVECFCLAYFDRSYYYVVRRGGGRLVAAAYFVISKENYR